MSRRLSTAPLMEPGGSPGSLVPGLVGLAKPDVPPAGALRGRDGELGQQTVTFCGKPDRDRNVAATGVFKTIARVKPGDGHDTARVTLALTREGGSPG